METLFNQSLGEAYSLYCQGLAPTNEVDLGLEAVIAIWEELQSRTDLS